MELIDYSQQKANTLPLGGRRMWAWPKGFEFDPVLRSIFVSACEAQEIYGMSRESWHPEIDKPTADFVWAEAKRKLLIY